MDDLSKKLAVLIFTGALIKMKVVLFIYFTTFLGAIVGLLIIIPILWIGLFINDSSSVVDFYLNPDTLENNNEKKIILSIEPFGWEIPFSTYKNNSDDLLWSPNYKFVGYTENIHQSGDISFEKEWALNIINPRTFQTETIYEGDYHTSNWEWLDDNELIIYYNCGTECLAGYIINVKTKKQKIINSGVGYQWSKDRKWIAAFRYSGAYGVVVSNRNQDKNFEYLEEKKIDYEYNPDEELKVFWAPTKNRLAIIKRKNQNVKPAITIIDYDQEAKILVDKRFKTEKCDQYYWLNDNYFACEILGQKEFIGLN